MAVLREGVRGPPDPFRIMLKSVVAIVRFGSASRRLAAAAAPAGSSKKKKKAMTKAGASLADREASAEDAKMYDEIMKWMDSKGPIDDRTAEEKAEHERIAKEYSRRCGERDRQHVAFFKERIALRKAAIAALPTEALRQAALLELESDQFPLYIPHAAVHPPNPDYTHAQK